MNGTRVILVLIIVAAAALRLIGLGNDGLWIDEGYTAYLTARPIRTYADELSGDTAPPLFYYVTRPMAVAFPRSEFALRLPSALFGVLAVGLVYLLGRELTGRPAAGLIAAALLAFSRMHIIRSQEARSYTLYLALAIIAMIALVRLARGRSPGRALLLALALAGMLYTHNIAAFFVLAMLLALLATAWPGRRGGIVPADQLKTPDDVFVPSPGRPRTAAIVAIAPAVALLYLPWLGVLRAQLTAVSSSYWIARPTYDYLAGQLANLLFEAGYPPDEAGIGLSRYHWRVAGGWFAAVGWAAAILGWAIWLPRTRDRAACGLLLALAGGLAGLVLYSVIRTPLFMDKSAIPFIVVPIIGIGLLGERLWHARRRWLGRSAVVAMLVGSAAVALGNHATNVHEQWREATAWTLARVDPAASEMILFDDPHNMMAAEWYLAGSAYDEIDWAGNTPHLLVPCHLRPAPQADGPCQPDRRDRPLNQLDPGPLIERLNEQWRPGQRLWVIQRAYHKTLCPPVETFIQSAGDEDGSADFHIVRVRQFVRHLEKKP